MKAVAAEIEAGGCSTQLSRPVVDVVVEEPGALAHVLPGGELAVLQRRCSGAGAPGAKAAIGVGELGGEEVPRPAVQDHVMEDEREAVVLG
jgi:hypothetical protein